MQQQHQVLIEVSCFYSCMFVLLIYHVLTSQTLFCDSLTRYFSENLAALFTLYELGFIVRRCYIFGMILLIAIFLQIQASYQANHLKPFSMHSTQDVKSSVCS